MSKLQNLVEVPTNTAYNRFKPGLRLLLQIFPFVVIRVKCYTNIQLQYRDAEKTRVIKISSTDLQQSDH